MQATYHQHILEFKRPSGTSRGVMNTKETWFLVMEENGRRGIGECGILRGLSVDDTPDYEEQLKWVCDQLEAGNRDLHEKLQAYPSIQMGVEMGLRSLQRDHPFILYPSDFTEGKTGIPINGLIWMGDPDFMQEQIRQKLSAGYRCIKMKIGAIDFEKELSLLKGIRDRYTAEELILRVDANGAFSPEEALDKLERLAEFALHSIEQPLAVKQWEAMAQLCKSTPVPIALDEELIGVFDQDTRRLVLDEIQPQYIILKPSLVGGFRESEHWIQLAEERGIGWWVTSALESNVGLNAIAQWTHTLDTNLHQGLGTGSLYTNNVSSPLQIQQGKIKYNPKSEWEFNFNSCL
ncbi:o-succinylbenzoate synthase [Croceiramulus getboli]|nr:o-succinylbenzoate synthase [Flavobacteriaceae bacterium YJPT1-3]